MFWYGHDLALVWMGVGMVLFWTLLVTGIVLLVRFTAGAQRDRQASPQALTAEQVLAARFVRGDITDGDYKDRLATLRDHARL